MIKRKILDNNFSFEFICQSYVNRNNHNLIAKIIVRPEMDRFNYYVVIEENNKLTCRIQIYCGRTTVFFGEEFSLHGKWKSDNELIIWGKQKEVEIHVWVKECKADFGNMTKYDNPPYFTLMRADISEEEREKTRQDWQHSLPPALSVIIRRADN